MQKVRKTNTRTFYSFLSLQGAFLEKMPSEDAVGIAIAIVSGLLLLVLIVWCAIYIYTYRMHFGELTPVDAVSPASTSSALHPLPDAIRIIEPEVIARWTHYSSDNFVSFTNDACPICLEELGNVNSAPSGLNTRKPRFQFSRGARSNASNQGLIVELPCGHYFHEWCVTPWLYFRSSECPLCKWDVRLGQPSTTRSINPVRWFTSIFRSPPGEPEPRSAPGSFI